MSSLIKKAIISEKSFVKAGESKFTFIVDKRADKESIAYECEKLFGVNVLEVNTANYIGKIKSTKRVKGKRNDYKKALVTVKPGQTIDLFELEAPEEKAVKTKSEKSKAKAEISEKDVQTVIKKKGKKIEE